MSYCCHLLSAHCVPGTAMYCLITLPLLILKATHFTNEKTEVYLSRGLEILGLSFKSTFNSVQLLNCVWLFATDGLQYATPPCPSTTPSIYSNSNPLSWWCHPTISSSVTPFSSCLQSFPASGSFQMSQLFASGGQSIGISASASVLPINIQDWFPSGWTGWISLQSKGLSTDFSNTRVENYQLSDTMLLYSPAVTSIHDYRKPLRLLDENSDTIFPSLWEKRCSLHPSYFLITDVMYTWIAKVITLCVTQRKQRKLSFSLYLCIFFGIHCELNSIY